MATVDVTIMYTIEVPELDETETEEERTNMIQDIYDDWEHFIDRDGYEANCIDVIF